MTLITLFTIALGYGVILPVLPFYTERLALGTGATPETIIFHIGFLTSIFPFFQMFFAPLWGRLSDKIGRKPLLIIGVLGFIIMQFLTGISTTLWMLYLARILGGIFTSAVIPVSYALISDLTSTENRARGIAYAGTSYSLGIVAGPFIGGILSQTDLHLNFRSSHVLINDFSVPFFFLVGLGLVLLPFVYKRIKNSDTATKTKFTNVSSLKWQKIVQMLFPFLVLSFIYQLALTLFEAVFSIYSKNELQFDAITIGYGFMVCALVMALLQPFVVSHKVKDKIPSKYQIILGFGMVGISLCLLVLANQLLIVMILIGVLAAGGAFITPNITSLISLKGGESSGGALGIQKSVDSLGQVIGPIAGSWLFTIESSLPYLLTGVSVITITLILFMNRRLLAVNI
jgi:DHA1 family multidrug resistance protein-like MFS transporter